MKKIKMLGMIIIAVVIVTFISCGPPRLKGTVTIDGDPHIGSTLTANVTSLGGSGTITYRWLRDETAGIGTELTYTLTGADKDASITVTVERENNTGSVTSAPVSNRGYRGSTGPGGGIIFYHDPAGFTMTDTGETAYFLEAAPVNARREITWASPAFYTNTWSTPGGTGNFRSIDGTSTAIGSGRKNTALILAIDANAPAALVCSNYSNNGLSDWFLPSRDELNELYRRRSLVGNLGELDFWSSSQRDLSNAWQHDFRRGSQRGSGKGTSFMSSSVRAIRAF